MKVYVVNNSGHNFTAAERYGKLVYLTSGKINIFATDRLIQELKGKLKGAEKGDFLLLSGYALLNIIVFNILMHKHGRVSVLIYDFHKREYVRRDLEKEVMENE